MSKIDLQDSEGVNITASDLNRCIQGLEVELGWMIFERLPVACDSFLSPMY